MGYFVFPQIDAARVESPYLRGSGPVAERLERDGRFNRPTSFEPSDFDIPQGIQSALYWVPLVTWPSVRPAEWVDVEEEEFRRSKKVSNMNPTDSFPIAAVALSCRISFTTIRSRWLSPAAERDVYVVPVEGHPDFGPFGGQRPSCGSIWMKSETGGTEK